MKILEFYKKYLYREKLPRGF